MTATIKRNRAMLPAAAMTADQLMTHLRVAAQPHLAQQSGTFLGIVLDRPMKEADEQRPTWTVYPFKSLEAMKDWYDDWVGNEGDYSYLAAIDRSQSMDPIYEAGLGQRRTRMAPSSNNMMVSGARHAPGAFDVIRKLVADHEVYWAAVAQRNPGSNIMRWWMSHKWDPFFREWMNLVTVHGLGNDDTDVLAKQLLELNHLRREAYEHNVPVPPVGPGSDVMVSGGGMHGGGGHGFHGGGGFHGGSPLHRPFPRPRPRGFNPRGFGYGGYDNFYGDVLVPVDPYMYELAPAPDDQSYDDAPDDQGAPADDQGAPAITSGDLQAILARVGAAAIAAAQQTAEGTQQHPGPTDHRRAPSGAPTAPVHAQPQPAPAPPRAPAPIGPQHAAPGYHAPTMTPPGRPAPTQPQHAQPGYHQPTMTPPGRPAPAPSSGYGHDHRANVPAPAPMYGRDHRSSAPPIVRDHRGNAPQAPVVRDHRGTWGPAPTHAPSGGQYLHQFPPGSRWPSQGRPAPGHGWHGHRGGYGRGGYYRPGARYPGRWVRGSAGPVWLESDVNLLLGDQPSEYPDLQPPSEEQCPLTQGDPNDTTQITDNGDGTISRQDATEGDQAATDDQGAETGAEGGTEVSSDADAGDVGEGDPAVTQGDYMYSPLSNSLVLCGRPFSPIVGDITIDAGLSSDNILTVTLQVEGRTYTAHADLKPLVTSSLPMIDQYVHPGARSLVGGKPDDQSVWAICSALVGRLVNEYQNDVVAGWLDDIGHAVKSAAVGVKDGVLAVHHAVATTVQKFKGPITVVATAVATAYGGPVAGAAAAKFCGPIIDGMAEIGKKDDHPAQQQLAAATQQAKADPKTAAALAAAKAAVANTVAGYHIKQTLANAASGDPNAKAAVADLAQKAQANNPPAKSAWDIATGLIADAASSYVKSKTTSNKLTPEEEAQIEIDPPSTVSGVAKGDPRAMARATAMATNGRVIGVVIPRGNPIQAKVFESPDDADDWYGQWLGMPHAFEYIAYYDRQDPSFPGPLNETIATDPARVSGAAFILPFLSGAATAMLVEHGPAGLNRMLHRGRANVMPPASEAPGPTIVPLATAPGTAPGGVVAGAALWPFLAGLGMGAGGYYGGEKLYGYMKERKAKGAATKASGWRDGRWSGRVCEELEATAMYGEY